MMPALSPNTQAILLLTAPLILGRGSSSPDLLSPGEYKRLARYLRDLQRQPADLISPDAAELLSECQRVIDGDRLARLLARGFLLSQVVERWHTRAIWVISRADTNYPRRLKARLREDAPAVLYGCGDLDLLETGGLAVVGSRHVDDTLIDYTLAIGRLSAQAGRTIVSGGAKGIDQAAMRGALEAGGKASGVLADSLEKTTMNREHRNLLLDGQLVLISPYDPSASFNVGNAMQRNKLIYALADTSLVVSCDLKKGGTWAGAVEQLDKLRFVSVYFRSTGIQSEGLDGLRSKGAIPWPNPADSDALDAVFEVQTNSGADAPQAQLALDSFVTVTNVEPTSPIVKATLQTVGAQDRATVPEAGGLSDDSANKPYEPIPSTPLAPAATSAHSKSELQGGINPAEKIFAAVRQAIPELLTSPMKEVEVAEALAVSAAQAKAWLQRLVDEGILEKQHRPTSYCVRQKGIFE